MASIIEGNVIKNDVNVDSIFKYVKNEPNDNTKEMLDLLNESLNKLYIDTVKFFHDVMHKHIHDQNVIYTTLLHLQKAGELLYMLMANSKLNMKYHNHCQNLLKSGKSLKEKYDDAINGGIDRKKFSASIQKIYVNITNETKSLLTMLTEYGYTLMF